MRLPMFSVLLFLPSLLALNCGAVMAASPVSPAALVDTRWGVGMVRSYSSHKKHSAATGETLSPNGMTWHGITWFSQGNEFPITAVPRPMTSWSPQTQTGHWFYLMQDHSFEGFRATHSASPWLGDFGQFCIMPEVGAAHVNPVRRSSPFNHRREVARPYVSSVYLNRYKISAALAPTRRCAILKFTFPASRQARILIDARQGGVAMRFNAARHMVSGWTTANNGGAPANFACYFVAQFDQPWTASRAVTSTLKKPLGQRHAYAMLTFNTTGNAVVKMRVATSFISLAQAQENLTREVPHWSLAGVEHRAKGLWNKDLSKVTIGGATPAQRKIFYTCLYEASTEGGSCYEPLFYEFGQDPNTYKDVDAEFMVGGAIKVSPILTQDVNKTFKAYFPSGNWVNIKDPKEICDGSGWFDLKNKTTVNVHLRPGALIPF